jgi:hypothetical protein
MHVPPAPVPSPTPTLTPPTLNETITSVLSYLQYFLIAREQGPSGGLPTPQEITKALFSYPFLNPTAAAEAEALYCDGLPGPLGVQCLQALQTTSGTITGLPGNGWGALPGSGGGGWADRCWTSFTATCLGVPPTGLGWVSGGDTAGGGGSTACYGEPVRICITDLN